MLSLLLSKQIYTCKNRQSAPYHSTCLLFCDVTLMTMHVTDLLLLLSLSPKQSRWWKQCSIIIPFSNKISYLLYITQNSIDTAIYGLYIWHWMRSARSDRRENLKIRFLNSKDDDLNNADFGHAIRFQKSRNSTSDGDIIYLKI